MSAESLEWSKAAETAPTEKIEEYRKSKIGKLVADLQKDLPIRPDAPGKPGELHTLRAVGDEDRMTISGSVGGEDIVLTETSEGVQGTLGGKPLAPHEAEIKYLQLWYALAERNQINGDMRSWTIREITGHHRARLLELEGAKTSEGADETFGKRQSYNEGNVGYDVRDEREFKILREGLKMGKEAAERILGFPCEAIKLSVLCSLPGSGVHNAVAISYADGNSFHSFFENNLSIPGNVLLSSDKIPFAEYVMRCLVDPRNREEMQRLAVAEK